MIQTRYSRMRTKEAALGVGAFTQYQELRTKSEGEPDKSAHEQWKSDVEKRIKEQEIHGEHV